MPTYNKEFLSSYADYRAVHFYGIEDYTPYGYGRPDIPDSQELNSSFITIARSIEDENYEDAVDECKAFQSDFSFDSDSVAKWIDGIELSANTSQETLFEIWEELKDIDTETVVVKDINKVLERIEYLQSRLRDLTWKGISYKQFVCEMCAYNLYSFLNSYNFIKENVLGLYYDHSIKGFRTVIESRDNALSLEMQYGGGILSFKDQNGNTLMIGKDEVSMVSTKYGLANFSVRELRDNFDCWCTPTVYEINLFSMTEGHKLPFCIFETFRSLEGLSSGEIKAHNT